MAASRCGVIVKRISLPEQIVPSLITTTCSSTEFSEIANQYTSIASKYSLPKRESML